MNHHRPRSVSLEAEIDALTRLVEAENRRILSPLVGDVRSAVEVGDFELARRLAMLARYNAIGRTRIAIPHTNVEKNVIIFFHTVYWWAHALVMLKAAQRHTGRWNPCRPFLRWRAACTAREAYDERLLVHRELL